MRSGLAFVGALALALSTVAATAMPFDPSVGRGDNSVAQARYGCGYGMTVGPYGHCRPRGTCPYGWHPGPHGWHCFRD